MLDGIYVDMVQGLVLGLKPKPEFLPLFNLGEPVTTGDSVLVTGGWSRVQPLSDELPRSIICQLVLQEYYIFVVMIFSRFVSNFTTRFKLSGFSI